MWLLYKSDLLRYRNIRGNCKNSTLFIFEKKRYIYLSIHLVCMFLLIQKTSKRLNRSGPYDPKKGLDRIKKTISNCVLMSIHMSICLRMFHNF